MGCRGSAATSGKYADGGPSDKQDPSAELSDDMRFETGETFMEMWTLTIVSCREAVSHWEGRILATWEVMEKALGKIQTLDSELTAAAHECSAAVASRESKRLATVLTKVSKQSSRAGVDFPGRVLKYNTKQVILCEEMLRVRLAILEAVRRQDEVQLHELISRAEAMGDTCLIEHEYVAELEACGKCEDGFQFDHAHGDNTRETALEKVSTIGSGGLWLEEARDAALGALELEPGKMPPAEELRAAFRKAALRWHPDRPQNHGAAAGKASERFRQAREAYNQLLSAAASAPAASQYEVTISDPGVSGK